MADVKVNEEAQRFASEIEQFLGSRKVILEEGARALLLLAAEEWMTHPPRVRLSIGPSRPVPVDPKVNPLSLITPILLEKVLQEEHIAAYGKRGARVPFFILLYALAKAGRDVLVDVMDKGL